MNNLIWILVGIFLLTACKNEPSQQANNPPIQVSVHPKGMAIITNEDSQSISFVNIPSFQIEKELKVGKRPRGVKVVKALNKAYVAVSGSPKCPPWIEEEACAAKKTDKSADGIAVIDLIKMEVTSILPSGSDPEQFDVSKDGKFLFIANEDVGKLSVVSTEKQQIIKEITVSEEPEGVRISPDGELVVVTCEEEGILAFINTQTYELVKMIEIGKRPRDLVFTKDSKTLYVTCEASGYVAKVDVVQQKLLSKIKLGGANLPVGIVLSDDEKSLYVAGGRGKNVLEIDLATEKVTHKVSVKDRPWGLDKDLSGTILISANGGSNDISFIDINKFEIIKNLKVGEGPWGVCVY